MKNLSCHAEQNFNCYQNTFRKGPKPKPFFWENFPKYGWVGWLIPKPAQNPQITPKTPQLSRMSPFVFPNLTKNLWWVSHTWENFPKKKRFVLGPSFKYPVFTQPRKERKLEVTCSGEKELIQYMLVKPHLCHQVAYFYSFWTCHCLLIHNIFSK